MELPDYWLSRPSGTVDESVRSAFDELIPSAPADGGCPRIDCSPSTPKWQLLCHLADRHGLLLHGSGDPDIERFEPRQANDVHEFGAQRAVYAASDGIWAMFFAVVDRGRVDSVVNACITVSDGEGATHGPFYVFSVSDTALREWPWRTGTVYVLPRASFLAEAPLPFGDGWATTAQWASHDPVVPLAKITVTPHDFPFLDRVRGHADDRLPEYALAMQTGAPWPQVG